MIIDGRAIAKEILARTKLRAEKLPHRPIVLAYVAPDETPATRSYLKIKAKSAEEAGCDFRETNSTEFPSDADAVIVQLPLPLEMNTEEVLNAIPVEKDADVLSSVARAAFESGGLRNPHLLPPVVAAVKHILEFAQMSVALKNAVVIGEGFLVGKPVATWLKNQGAEVIVATKDSGDLSSILATADIIVSGAGSPHFITPDMIKEGVVIIDAGTSESNGTLKGDADPACAAKCSMFTPVPGGVGPIAVACLFENAVTLAERSLTG